MQKRYLIGKNKFQSDVFWCLLISVLITLRYMAFNSTVYTSYGLKIAFAFGYMLPIFPIIFVLFFLWSWKKEDAQSYQARRLLKITCVFWFIFASIATVSALYSMVISGLNGETVLGLLITSIITILIVKKYCNLMNIKIR